MRKLSTFVLAGVLLTSVLAAGAYAQATRLVLRIAGDSTVTWTAGQSKNLTITARTAAGAVFTGYSGLKSLVFSGANPSTSPVTPPSVVDSAGVARSFSTTTTIKFTNGVATVAGSSNGVMSLYAAENVAISVTDGSIGSSGTDRLSVTVNPAAVGKFAWSLTSPQTNGSVFSGTNTLTAQDDWGNTVTSYNANSPSSNNVTVTTSLSGTITGLGGLNTNVLNQAGDFVSGVANLTTQGMTYTGVGGAGTFTATNGTGKTGTSASIQMNAAQATRLVLRTAAGDSLINIQAGSAQNLRIMAKDANGNTDLTYAGARSLTFSGADPSQSPVTAPTVSNSIGSNVAFGTATSITFVNGVATASGSSNGVMLLYRAQSRTVTVTDGSRSSSGNDALAVTVSAGALGKFAWSLTSPQTNGVTFTGTDILTAQDDWGNTDSSFDASAKPVTVTSSLAGTITGLGSGGNNILNRSTDFSSGAAILNGKMRYTGASGSGTFTASGGGKSGTSSSILINAGMATRLVVRTTTGDSVITSAAGIGRGLTITARDASGNTATGYSGSKTLTFFGAGISPAPESKSPTVSDAAGNPLNFSASTPITFSSGVATASGGNNGVLRLYKVESASVGASDGSITTATADQLTVTVTPGGLGRFAVVLTSGQTNGVPFTGVNTVTAIDSFGNPATNFNASANQVTVTSSLSGTISGLGSALNNILNQGSDFSSGVANLTGKIKYTGTVGAGTFTATAATGKTGTTAGNVTINVGTTSRFVVSGSSNQQAGSSQNLTITAMDSSGNVATGYTGDKTLRFSGSGASSNPITYPTVSDKDGFAIQFGAQLSITFASGVAQASGGANGVLRLYRAGKDTIAVTTTDGTISSGPGDRLIITVTADALQKFVFTLASPQQSGVAFTGTNTLIAQDNYGNVVTSFNAASDNVTVSALAPLSGTVSGLGSGSNNILNQGSDFSGGVANLTGKLVFTGTTGSAPFTAASSTSKAGTSGTVQIVAGGATRLVINGVASMPAGGTQSLTITARDASGNTVATYTGSKSLIFSGADSSLSRSAPTVTNTSGTAIAFGVATPILFTNGVATVSGGGNGAMRLYRAQTAIISVTDGTISASGADRLTVTVSPAGLGGFAWSLTSPQTSGVAFAGTNTLAAQDDWGNTVLSFDASTTPVTVTTSLAGTVSGLGSGGDNILNRAGDFVAGVANLTTLGMKYSGTVGTGTFTATGGGKTGVSASIQIAAGTATRLVVRTSAGDSVLTMIAGAVQNLTITAKDASGNTVATYAGAKTLTFAGADPSLNPEMAPTVSNNGGTATSFGAATVLTFTNGVATVTGSSNGVMKLYRAQTALISVTDGTRISNGTDRLSVTVNPAPLGKFAWLLSTPQVNGVVFSGTNTLTAQDDWGNTLTAFDASARNVTVTTTLSGAVTGLGTGSTNILNRPSDFVAGVANLTSIGMKYTGAIGTGTFTATAAGKAGTSLQVVITPGGAGKFVITGSGTQIAGAPQNLTITAKDASDNLVPTYGGLKSLKFSGANPSTNPLTQPTVTDNSGALIPFGSVTSILFTNGVATASAGSNGVMTLYKAETATIAVSDDTVSAAGPDRLTVTVAPATLGKFSWVLADPQINGAPWTGINTLTAQDGWGNAVPTFDAATNNVTLTTSLSPSPSAITGLGTLANNVLNQSSDFVLGVANLTALQLKYRGTAGRGTFTATSTVGSKTGMSDSITVGNPIPTFASISPAEGSRSQVVAVTVNGTNFLQGVTVLSLGQDVKVDSIRVESPTRLTALVRPGPTATLGPRNATVSNPAPGGGAATLTAAFRVKNIPSIISLTPSAGVRGQTMNVIIAGTNFAPGVSEVGLQQGVNITVNSTTVTSDTTIVVNISISLTALDGVRQFYVTNSGAEGGPSNLSGFTVGSNPLPDVASISPTTVTRGQSVEFTLTGTNFFNGITSVNLGSGIVVTSVNIDSTTQLRIAATITDTAAGGSRDVILINAPPGGGPDTLKNGLTISNPAPTLTGVSVQNAARLQTLYISLTGTRFLKNVTTVDMGTGITYISTVAESPTQLRVGFSVDSSAALGSRNIKVTNPAPGGGSDTLVGALTINNPAPSITTLSPESTKVGGGPLVLTVNGSNFVPGVSVRFGGRVLTSTLVNRTRMTASLAASDIDTARSFVVDVFAPTPGGGTSNPKNFIVQNPVPTLTSFTPSSGSRLQTLDLTFTGTNFVPGFTQVDFGAADITTNSITVTGSTQLKANITISASATMGPRDIFLRNPAPGGGNSEKRIFTVANNPVPTIASVYPSEWSRLRTVDLAITGTNFITGVTSANFGTGIILNGPIVVDSSTKLTANVTISATAPTGPRAISVTNAAPGGGTATKPNAFTVFNPGPRLLWLYPSNAQQLQTLNIVFNGQGFIDGVSAVSLGTGITINEQNVLSDTVITANVTITLGAATGARDVVVTNTEPGGGVSVLTNGFVVGNNPGPTLSSISPTTAKRLETLNMVLRGSNFVSGVTTVDLGSDITVNGVVVDSAGKLTANITVTGKAATGARTVYVTNAPPGGGRDSMLAAFTVTNPAPTLTSIAPTFANRSQTLNVVLRGTNFIPASVPSFGSGGDITVNSVTADSARQLTVNVTVGATATLGPRNVSVTNPTPGGGTSASMTFSVNLAPPATPTLVAPSNGRTDLPTTLVLKWDAAGATNYHLQLSTSSLFLTTLVDDSSLTATSRQVGPLSNNVTYYWRVRARNAGGTSSFSSTWSFTPLYPTVYPLSNSWEFPSYATAAEYKVTDYKIVGLPGAGTSLAGAYFTGTVGTDWLIYTDNGTTANYFIKYDGTSAFTFAAGKAYWLIKKNPWTVNTSVPTAVLDTSVSVRIALHSGWNLITNPFLNSVPWSSIQLANDPAARSPIWSYGGVNGFEQSTTLESYMGYYFFNTDNVAYIRVPYGATSGVWRKADSSAQDGWTVTVAARSGEYTDRALMFGVREDASDGLDRYDYRKPRAMGTLAGTMFVRPDLDSLFTVFATDFRPPVQSLARWPFAVQTPAKEAVTLRFEGIGQIPEGLDVAIIDHVHAKYADLRASQEYIYTPATATGQLTVAVGTHEAMAAVLGDVVPKVFALDNNFPNPFNPSTTLPVAVPHTAEITVKVYNILGEEVRTLFTGQVEAGRHWLIWDGRNDTGAPVATGVYLARLTAESGVSFVKKMLLMK